jgi:hypothetical protein
MDKYAYYREPIDCPECGFLTHELYNATDPEGQQALLCQNCFDDKHEEATDWETAYE